MLARVVAVSLAGVKLDLGLPSRAIDSLPALELGERCCRGPAWGAATYHSSEWRPIRGSGFESSSPHMFLFWHFLSRRLLTTNRSWDRA
jgi:hypothetical protein